MASPSLIWTSRSAIRNVLMAKSPTLPLKTVPVLLALLWLSVLSAHASSDGMTIIGIEYENDVFVGSGQDRWFSNGFKFNWTTNRRPPPEWVTTLANTAPGFAVGEDDPWGWSLEQRMFTPDNIEDPLLPPLDRPYAGWLNASLTLGRVEENRLTRVHMGLGVVGRASLAEPTQKAIHRLIGAAEPVGWDTQLPTEVTVTAGWNRQWRLAPRTHRNGWQSDWNPATGIMIGNAITFVGGGGFWRIGKRLPDDFGPPRITTMPAGSIYFRPTHDSGWYFQAGANVRYVAHNVFLDGNTFRNSPSVECDPLLGEVFAGAVYYRGNMRISYGLMKRSREFKGQASRQNFGVVTIVWTY